MMAHAFLNFVPFASLAALIAFLSWLIGFCQGWSRCEKIIKPKKNPAPLTPGEQSIKFPRS